MGVGLQVFDAGGNLTFNSADYLARFIGSIYTGQATGSVIVPAFSSGGGFAITFPDGSQGKGWVVPATYIYPWGFEWNWPSDAGVVSDRCPALIFYGTRL